MAGGLDRASRLRAGRRRLSLCTGRHEAHDAAGRLPLDCDWRVTWTDYGCRAGDFSAPAFDDSSWLPADVPGDVHLDLLRAGVIPDPFAGANTDAVLWMEHKDWWYRTQSRVPEDWAPGRGTAVHPLLHGLDGFATVYLDGAEVGRHANMFRPLEVAVTKRLRPGRRRQSLAVRLASPLFAPMDLPSRQETPWGHPRQLSRKAQMSYGWAIAPRLVTIGLWRPVELLLVDRARIADAFVRTRRLFGPDRPYIPSSPDSPARRRYNDPTDSEVHLWKHGASYTDACFREHRAKFISEIGFLSLPDVAVIRGYLGGAALWPPEGRAASTCLSRRSMSAAIIFSRSRSLPLIRSSTPRPPSGAAPKRGQFYFAETGHYHFAAT
jgi:hypothetical protein